MLALAVKGAALQQEFLLLDLVMQDQVSVVRYATGSVPQWNRVNRVHLRVQMLVNVVSVVGRWQATAPDNSDDSSMWSVQRMMSRRKVTVRQARRRSMTEQACAVRVARRRGAALGDQRVQPRHVVETVVRMVQVVMLVDLGLQRQRSQPVPRASDA